MKNELNLGHGHFLRYVSWTPDRDLNPQVSHLPDVERWGAILRHPHSVTGSDCEGMLTFHGPVQQELEPNRPKWTVESWEPLTLSPSVLCGCGDHGFVRNGIWEPC